MSKHPWQDIKDSFNPMSKHPWQNNCYINATNQNIENDTVGIDAEIIKLKLHSQSHNLSQTKEFQRQHFSLWKLYAMLNEVLCCELVWFYQHMLI